MNLDFGVFRDFAVGERFHLQFRAESFNVVKHPNLLDISTGFGNGTYGRVISALDPRIMEFGFKVIF